MIALLALVAMVWVGVWMTNGRTFSKDLKKWRDTK